MSESHPHGAATPADIKAQIDALFAQVEGHLKDKPQPLALLKKLQAKIDALFTAQTPSV